MAAPEFRRLDEVTYGAVEQVTPLIRRVIAENPSKFTADGTGAYLVGHGDVVVIDPGPVLDSHRAALQRALEGERVRAILITHCHTDHSPLAAWMREEYDAPTFAFGPHPRPDPALVPPPEPDDAPDSATDSATGGSADEPTGEIVIEESVEYDFEPDVRVGDGEVVVDGGGLTMRGVHTPGHTSNHMCWTLEEESTLFSGDHVMGWSTTVVSPPDGDMAAYVDSLRRVAGRGDAVLWPTHGPCRDDVASYVGALIDHRLAREAAVLGQVRGGLGTAREIVEVLYADVRRELHKPAARSVWGHLVQLVDAGLVAVEDGGLATLDARYVAV